MEGIVDEIGYQGPLILTTLTSIQLLKQPYFLITYLVGFFINKQLNKGLKLIFREPRPEPIDLKKDQERDPLRFFKKALMRSDGIYISKAHIYGMPSGHAQTASYALAFLYLIKKRTNYFLKRMDQTTILFFIMITIYFITIYQRWNSKAHSLFQLTIGTIVGTCFAIIAVKPTVSPAPPSLSLRQSEPMVPF
jgi:membrane-associated phospholipid phosphatase